MVINVTPQLAHFQTAKHANQAQYFVIIANQGTPAISGQRSVKVPAQI